MKTMLLLLILLLPVSGHSANASRLNIDDCAKLVSSHYTYTDGQPAKETPLFYDRSTFIFWESYSTQELNRRYFEVLHATRVKITDSYNGGARPTRRVEVLEGQFKGRSGWVLSLKDLAPTHC